MIRRFFFCFNTNTFTKLQSSSNKISHTIRENILERILFFFFFFLPLQPNSSFQQINIVSKRRKTKCLKRKNLPYVCLHSFSCYWQDIQRSGKNIRKLSWASSLSIHCIYARPVPALAAFLASQMTPFCSIHTSFTRCFKCDNHDEKESKITNLPKWFSI